MRFDLRLVLPLVLFFACTSPTTVQTPSMIPTDAPTALASATPSTQSSSALASALPISNPATVLSAVHFADAAHGWLGLEAGLLGTLDGGSTWSHEIASQQIARIWSFDPKTAWALAADDTVYRTNDGVQWSAIPPTTPPITDIQFVSPLVGWAIAVPHGTDPAGFPNTTGTLLGSTDGGLVWRPVGTRSIRSVCFADAQKGWGAYGRHVFKTYDGGRTWTTVFDVPLPSEDWFPRLACDGMHSARLVLTGFGAALSHAPYVVYRTANAGSSWTLEFGEHYTLDQLIPRELPEFGSYPPAIGSLAHGETWLISCTPPTGK